VRTSSSAHVQQVEGALDAELLQLASDRALTAKLGAKLMDTGGRSGTKRPMASRFSNSDGRRRMSTDNPAVDLGNRCSIP
jgi:hypothetical protein